MRPTRLELEGFTSFRERAAVDFSSLDLFAITGPTGAGKTSLLDAILYALYGQTPRLGEREIADLISQGALRLQVLLEFSAAGQRYRIMRTVKRAGKTVQSTPRLEAERPDQTWEPLADKVADVKQRIEQIIGLDFDGFTRSVVLPQGKFDEFLRGDARQRRKILTDLLRLEIYVSMARRAREKADTAGAEIGLLEQQLTAAQGAEEHLKTLETELDELAREEAGVSERLRRAAEARPLAAELRTLRRQRDDAARDLKLHQVKLAQAGEAARAATRALDQHQRRLAELDRSIQDLGYDENQHLQLAQAKPLVDQLEALRRSLAEKQKGKQDHTAALGSAESASLAAAQEQERAARNLASAGQTVRQSEQALQTAQAALLAAQKSEVEASIQQIQSESDALGRRIKSWQPKLKSAGGAWEEAAGELENLRSLHAAAELRRGLKKGAPCPVCQRIVSATPKPARHAALHTAQQLVEQRRLEKEQLEEQVRSAQSRREALTGQVHIHHKNRGEIEAGIRDLPVSLPALGPGDTPDRLRQNLSQRGAELRQAREALETARAAESRARQQTDRRRSDRDLLSQKVALLDRQIAEVQQQIRALESQLEPWGGPAELSSRFQLLEQARRRREEWREERQRVEERRQSEEQRLADASERVAVARGMAGHCAEEIEKAQRQVQILEPQVAESFPGLTPSEGLDEAAQLDRLSETWQRCRTELRENIARAETRREQVRGQLAEAARIAERLAERKSWQALCRELGVALAGDHFIAFFQQQALRRLAAEATKHFRLLSREQYSLVLRDDRFFVVDHWNASQERPVETLSGGETFLASLSLALALASSLAEFCVERERFALDSLFLDEGFGTLDPETLETVVSGIESLAASHRLIGVISHVPELGERFPARIEVRKGPAGSFLSGATSPF